MAFLRLRNRVIRVLDKRPVSQSSVEVPTFVNPSADDAVTAGVNLANTVVAILKDVGEMLNSIPYVKSLSGVVLQIIKIREEIKSNKERCREIIDKVLRISKSIYERLADVALSTEKDKLSRLESHLGDCTRTLLAVYAALNKYRSRRLFSKLINRGLDELNVLDRRVDELNIKLILDILVDIKLEQVVSVAKEDQPPAPQGTDHVLPPKPHLMIEREAQIDSALRILLDREPTRIAILGGGGFGKTTLARTILHDQQISKHYEFRYFLSCEGMDDVESLLLGLGTMLGIKASPSAMLASIRTFLAASSTLMCLDNFETPWEPAATRTKVEELLSSIADIPNLSLIITMRGMQRPSKVPWSQPLLPPLSTLSTKSALLILQAICPNHTVDNFTEQLLDGIDGIPLAVTLVSNLFRDGETSQSLWRRWSKKQTGIIHTGADDRQSSLNASISLSVENHRMKRDPDATVLLAVLSLLPSGFPSDTGVLAKLEEYLGIRDIHSAFQTLRTVSLIEMKISSTTRIQMLSPIRLFCHEFLSSEISLILEKVVNYYISIMLDARDKQTDSKLYAQVVPEIQNLHSVFQKVYKTGYSEDITRLIQSTIHLTEWSQYIGYLTQDTIHMALERSTNLPIPHANCLLSLGDLYFTEGHDARAEKCFNDATELFKQESDAIGEARAWYLLGNVLLYTGKQRIDEAEVALKASLELDTKLDDKKNQANVHLGLGHLYMNKYQYSEAETSLTNALEAYKQIPNLIGQAKAALHLSLLHINLRNLFEAQKFVTESLAAAKEANYALGEGNALQWLGCIYLGADRITDARQAIEQAQIIYKQLNDPINQLLAVNELGEVYIQSDQLEIAETLLTTSIKVELDVIQIPIIMTTLGWLYICGGRLDKAESHLSNALQLFQKFDDKSWEANVLIHLGIAYLNSNRLDQAEQTLNSVPDMEHQRSIEIRRLWVLGELYIHKGHFADAEILLHEAMTACQSYRGYSFSYQQGNILRSWGILHVKRNRVNWAVQTFKRALEFHRKAQWASEQATDLKQLGEAYRMLGRTEDADVVFKNADALMETVREARVLKL